MKQITNSDIVRIYYKNVWNLKKFEILKDLIDEDFIFESSLGPTLKGRLQFTKYIYSFIVAFPNLYHEVDTITENENGIFVQTNFYGDNLGRFFNLSPSYKKIYLKSTTTFEIKDGKITKIIDNIDIKNLNRQINISNLFINL